ncbi:MAG: hypothetical protein RMM31_06785, partial [Anaerolineae bacterium]|nr:hypothetical protein [Anaerolineae bacterium]
MNLKAETEPKAEPRKVYVIVYDPLLRNGKRLSEHLKWQDHRVFTREAIRFFREVSKGYLDYKVVQTV